MILKGEVFRKGFSAGVTDVFSFSEVVGSVAPHVNLRNQQLAYRTFQEDDHCVLTVLSLCHPTSGKFNINVKI